MTSINFPLNPTEGQIYEFSDRSWVWNGRSWRSISTFVGFTGSQGIPGEFAAIGFTGSAGFTGSSGGVNQFTELTDTPSSYTGHAGKVVVVNETETGLEFTTAGTGGGGGGGGLVWSVKTANYSILNGEAVFADTSQGSFTITLPATPTLGDTFAISDNSESWDTNNIILNRNGNTIMRIAENFLGDVSNATMTFVYDGSSWILM
jgi:hypothetical protein